MVNKKYLFNSTSGELLEVLNSVTSSAFVPRHLVIFTSQGPVITLFSHLSRTSLHPCMQRYLLKMKICGDMCAKYQTTLIPSCIHAFTAKCLQYHLPLSSHFPMPGWVASTLSLAFHPFGGPFTHLQSAPAGFH